MNEPNGLVPSRTLERQDYVWLAVLLAAFSFLFMWNAWAYELWDPWEPKYAGTITEMRERGEFVTPWFDDRIRWTKPVLTYWLMLVPIAIFGNSEFTARLPMMLLAVGGVLMTYYFLLRLRGRTTAVVGACILGTMPQYFYMARQAMPDMPLNVFLGCALGFFALGRFTEGARRAHFAAFYVFCALAFLTKGPVGAVLITGTVLLFWLLEFRVEYLTSPARGWAALRGTFSFYHVGMGLLIFLILAGPWYGMMWIKHGNDFTANFFGDENLERFTEPIKGHHGTTEYYVGIMFRGLYPWIGFLPLAALFLFQGVRSIDDDLRQRWYFVSWFTATFLLFTVAGTKLAHYILPITIPTAILVALVWEAYFRKDSPYWVRPVILGSLPFAFLPTRDFFVEGSYYIFDVFQTKSELEYPGLRGMLIGFFVAWAVVTLLAWFLRRSKVAFALAVLIAFSQGVYFTHYVMPDHSRFRSMKSYLDYYETVREQDAELAFYGWIRYSMYYYKGKENFQHFEYNEVGRLDRYLRSRGHVYVVAHRKYVDRLYRSFRRHADEKLIALDVPAPHNRFVLLKKVPASAPGVAPPIGEPVEDD